MSAWGLRRVGGALARIAWTGFMRASKEMAEQGTFTEFANGYPGGELNKMFS
jgi:hypothetical protein